jgi:hypothetical protein
MYGFEEPHEYDLKSVNEIHIFLISGKGEKLATPKNVEWLKELLGNDIVMLKEYDLGHTGFLMAKDMRWFNDVIEISEFYR